MIYTTQYISLNGKRDFEDVIRVDLLIFTQLSNQTIAIPPTMFDLYSYLVVDILAVSSLRPILSWDHSKYLGNGGNKRSFVSIPPLYFLNILLLCVKQDIWYYIEKHYGFVVLRRGCLTACCVGYISMVIYYIPFVNLCENHHNLILLIKIAKPVIPGGSYILKRLE